MGQEPKTQNRQIRWEQKRVGLRTISPKDCQIKEADDKYKLTDDILTTLRYAQKSEKYELILLQK
jgi:hypothetical protein